MEKEKEKISAGFTRANTIACHDADTEKDGNGGKPETDAVKT